MARRVVAILACALLTGCDRYNHPAGFPNVNYETPTTCSILVAGGPLSGVYEYSMPRPCKDMGFPDYKP